MLWAYILNGITIVFVTVEDKVKRYLLYKRKKEPFKNKTLTTIFDYLILEKYHTASMKSSLYLFYIFALVVSQVLIIHPYIEASESLRSYFTTVGFGLVLLVAVDKFLAQFMKDDKDGEERQSKALKVRRSNRCDYI